MGGAVGALAILTLGAAFTFGMFLFLRHNKDPKNFAATKAVVEGRESAATAVSAEGVDGRSLRQRLDEAPSVDDRLSNRPVGPISLLLDVKWSELRATMKGTRTS